MTRLQGLLQEIHDLEEQVTEEIFREAEEFGYSIYQGRVSFEREIAKHHKALATQVRLYLAGSSLPFLLTAPLVYSLLFPLALLDIFLWVYQAICFPVYGMPRARRADYIVLDRHQLRYLNVIERMHCTYCSYANGLVAYAQEVAARTEQYWCPIKHARRLKAAHSRYQKFLSYGDAEGYVASLEKLRKDFSGLS